MKWFIFLLLFVEIANAQCADSVLDGKYHSSQEIGSCLIGKTIYLLKADWQKWDESKHDYFWNFENPRRYIPVKILRVVNSDDIIIPSIMIVFDAGQFGKGLIEMNFGDDAINDASSLPELFSSTDPKKKHPNVSSKNWALIQQGKVRIGWNKELCTLSWGEPSDINRTINQYGSHEQWVYDGGYLYFNNGKLESIQN